jgi:FixJ family two-component response regulator
VWVADDEDEVKWFLTKFLGARGYSVEDFDSGEQVVSRLRGDEPPSLLLLDVLMPRLDGLEVLDALDKRGVRVPTIVSSGINQASTAVQAMRLGAVDYLVKPLKESALEVAIGRAFDTEKGILRTELNEFAFGRGFVSPIGRPERGLPSALRTGGKSEDAT